MSGSDLFELCDISGSDLFELCDMSGSDIFELCDISGSDLRAVCCVLLKLWLGDFALVLMSPWCIHFPFTHHN